jgi:hypothetical protein
VRKLVLVVGLVLMAGGAQAASYLRLDGVVHDPIGNEIGVPSCSFFEVPPPLSHSYSGPDLEPGVHASGAELSCASLHSADLRGADLSYANLRFTSLYGANLSGANLSGASFADELPYYSSLSSADLSEANLVGAGLSGILLVQTNLSGANLSGADLSFSLLGPSTGIPYYDALTNFAGAGVSDQNQGWNGPFDPVAAGWVLVPEPSTALLVGIGLAGIAARRRPATAR